MNKVDRASSILFVLTLLTLFTLGFSSQGRAATYFVATNGTDSSTCGSSTSPCSTIPYVLAAKVSAGDTIKIKPGNYVQSAKININDTVRHDNLTITAEDPQNRPVLIFDNNSIPEQIEIALGVTGVTLSYLEIKGGTVRKPTWGWIIMINDNPTTVDNVLLYNQFIGIAVNTGKNVTLSNNVIHTMGRFETNPNDAAGSGVGIGIYNFSGNPAATGWNEKIYIHHNELYDIAEDGVINVNSNYKYIEIAYNNSHHNYEDGLDWKDTQYVRIHHNDLHDNWGNGIGSNSSYPSHDFEIWANRIYNNGWWGIMIQGGSYSQNNWKIWNNLIYGNCNNPAYYGCNGVDINGVGHEFYYNVVYNNNVPGNLANAGLVGGGIIENNIFFNNGVNSNGNINAGGTIDHNYVYPTSPGGTGTNAITVSDPGLTDPAGGDFTLKAGSPLIDAGVAVPSVTDDFAGTARPIGTNPDIGAFEFNTGAPTVTLTPSVTSAVVPFTVSFTAAATDPNGTIQKYEWDLDGDGVFEYDTGLVASNFTSFTSVGTYTVTVRVTDNDGNWAISSRTISANSSSAATTGSGGGGGGGCFIATASFGTPLAPQVRLLSEFRDEYLLTNEPGRWFVRMYYTYSPPIADYIRDRETLKAVIRAGLLPLITFGDFMVNTTPAQKRLIVGALLALLTVAGSLLLHRRRHATGPYPFLRTGR